MPRPRLALQGPATIVRLPPRGLFDESSDASARYDVLGIGNAIVDVIARAEEDFLLRQGMNKGAMALIDARARRSDLRRHGSGGRMSGGSAANTIVGVAARRALGLYRQGQGRSARPGFCPRYPRRRRSFRYAAGRRRRADRALLMLVTPDGERTMNTFLGAAQDLHPADIDADMIAASAITYLEGYLWDPKNAKDAFLKAAEIAHDAERMVALTLVGCLLRRSLARRVFASHALRHGGSDLRQRGGAAQPLSNRGFRHRGGGVARRCRDRRGDAQRERMRGASAGRDRAVPAFPVERVVDTTGAGDLFAAGFLSGLARGGDDEPAAGSARWPPPK